MRLGHVAVSVSDIGKASKFYCRWFGLKRKKTFRNPSVGLTICLLKGDFTLELFQFKKRKPLPAYRRKLESDLPVLGVKHFCIEVPRIAALYGRFRKARIPFATEMRTFEGGTRYFFVKDPDGNLVEIMEAV
jgi:glyoxylase I family protein